MPAKLPEDAVKLPPRAANWITKFQQAERYRRYYTAEAGKAKEQLVRMLSGAAAGVSGTNVVRYTAYETHEFDMVGLSVQHPKIWEKFRKEKTRYRFTVQSIELGPDDIPAETEG